MIQAVYFGAQYDLTMLALLKTVKKFVFIEAYPKVNLYKLKINSIGKNFFAKIDKMASFYGFTLSLKNDKKNLLVYKKSDVFLYYFHSTFIDENLPVYICKLLKGCDTLINIGSEFNIINWKYLPNVKNLVFADDFSSTLPNLFFDMKDVFYYNYIKNINYWLFTGYIEFKDEIYDNDPDSFLEKQLSKNCKILLKKIKKVKCFNILDVFHKKIKSNNKLNCEIEKLKGCFFETIKSIPKNKFKLTEKYQNIHLQEYLQDVSDNQLFQELRKRQKRL